MTTATDDRPQRAAFVLSGGGSLGAVQVGMLQALGGAGVEPDLLVGTSAGAVNATWVAGHGMSGESLAELARLWRGLRRRELFPVHPERVLGALLGLSHAVSSSDRLGELVREHAGFGDLADAAVETHLIATDLLTGHPVLLTRGPVDTAVRASAAVPGLYPPVLIDGRHLVDGGVAQHAGLEDAVRLGATTIWVLPTGYPCALTRPPRSAIGIALQALTLLTEQRLITEVAASAPSVTVKVLPPLCPLAVSAADFSHARELIARARRATTRWLAEGGPDLPTPERFLALHHHPHQLPLQHPDAVGRGASGASLETLGGKVAGFRGSVAGDCPSRDAWNGGGRGRRPVRTEVTTVASCPRPALDACGGRHHEHRRVRRVRAPDSRRAGQ